MHALTLEDPDNPAQTVILPLALQGVTSLLNVRAPTIDKWLLTSESLTWDPSTTLYEDQKVAMTGYSINAVRCVTVRGHVGNLVINLLSSLTADLVDVIDDDNFY